MAEDLSDLPLFCKVCRSDIPEERAKRRASTCSDECLAKSKKKYRNRFEGKYCRFCLRPATPMERATFHRWRKFQGAALSRTLQTIVTAIGDEANPDRADALARLKLDIPARELAQLKALVADQAHPPVGLPEKKVAAKDDEQDAEQDHANESTAMEVVQ